MRPLLPLLTALVAVAACDDAPPVATLTETPAAFVGRWDVSVAECEAGGGEQGVTVSAKEVVLPNATLAVSGAAPDGEAAARIDGHFTGPGAEWDGSVRLELSNGGRELNVVNGSTMVPRVKCP